MFEINESADAIGKILSLKDLSMPDTGMMIVALAVFIGIAYFALRVLKNAIISAVIGALFPLVLKNLLGFQIDATPETMLFYSVIGVFLYLAYEVIMILYGTSKIFIAIVNIFVFPFVAIFRILSWISGLGDRKRGKNDAGEKEKGKDTDEDEKKKDKKENQNEK